MCDNSLEVRIAELEKQVANLDKSNCCKLKAERDKLLSINERWESKRRGLQDCLCEIGSDGSIYGSTFDEAIAVLRHWRKRIDDLNADLAEARQAAETLRTERDNARKESERLRAERDAMQNENKRLRHIHRNMYLSAGGWIYQGDGYDHLESLTCSVVIQPGDLTVLLKERDILREFVEACSQHQSIELGNSDEYDIHGVNAISQVAKRCLELADAAKELIYV